MACGIFLEQGLNPCLLHWQMDSQSLDDQGSPKQYFILVLRTYQISWNGCLKQEEMGLGLGCSVVVVVKLLICVQLFASPMDYSHLGSSVHGISQARILECIFISFSRSSSQHMD